MASDVLERIQQGSLLFSIFSLCTCVLITLLIIFQKQLRSITFTFLMCIFGSEIVQSIGNIILDKIPINEIFPKAKNITALSFIAFSDMFTNLLFVFFTYCSIKLIKESNKLIKTKVPRFIIISLIISVIYMSVFIGVSLSRNDGIGIIDIRFRMFYTKHDIPNLSLTYYILSSVHIFLIMVLSIISLRNTCVVLNFMKEKQQTDKINAPSIARLIKILGRYPAICILYWAFLIPRLIFVATSGQKHILRDSLYFISESLFRLRGFLIFLNTIRSSKILLIFYKIIQVNIKHNCLLNLKICRKKRRPSLRSKSKSDEIERPLMV
jgi:hypothetical protein